jgi:EpsI family protein
MTGADHSASDGGQFSRLSSRRELLVGGALVSAALLAGGIRTNSSRSEAPTGKLLEQLVPEQIGSWRTSPFSGVLIPTGETAEERSYDDVLTRYYQSATDPGVMLLVAYSGVQAGETALHRPEVCYPAAGFRLRRWPDMPLAAPHQGINAASMTAVAPGRVEQILYWSRIGDLFPTTSFEQRWAVLKQSLRGTIPDGVLVRISTIEADRASALRSLQRFASALLQPGNPKLGRLLGGSA